jgi:glycosyltransferase involved in cell wall biosynthesis
VRARTPGPRCCDDIVISCIHDLFYRWDPLIAQTRGVGGSEIAVIHAARHLKELTGRAVKVFNTRADDRVIDGVEYASNSKVAEYFARYEPAVHLAWRHNTKVTNALTYVWSHDIWVAGAEKTALYDRLMVLSPYQKRQVMAWGIPSHKVFLSRNGIDLERFEFRSPPRKKRGNVVYSSCPTRGLEAAMNVMDKVVERIPEAELHVFYGFEGLHITGRGEEVRTLERAMAKRSYVKYHGNVPQRELVRHLVDAEVWLYPTTFAETFCITALEMLGCGVYPVVRKFGALPDTLATASKLNMCELVDLPCETEEQRAFYAERVVNAIVESKHERVRYDLRPHSWREVVKEWMVEWRLEASAGVSVHP